jgi:hypothetical protein
MSSVHRFGPGEQYDCGRAYNENEKRQVTPEELMRWLSKRTLVFPTPGHRWQSDPSWYVLTLLPFGKSNFVLHARLFARLKNRFKRWKSYKVRLSQ